MPTRRNAKRNVACRFALCKASKQHLVMPGVRTPNRTTRRSSDAFPPELYRNIFEWVTDKRDLYNLSLTSRLCCAEAQRALYSVIDLAQNTRAPVLWADTILRHPQKAATVRSLTLRFDLSFIIVPDLLLSSLRSIAQALKALLRLEKLVLVGHPLAMMHPIHTWILDGCTANLRTFHNSVFPPWAVVPFLSRHSQLCEWKQSGLFPGGDIADTVLPRLTTFDGHTSILASFKGPRSLEQVRLKIDDWGRETAREREAIEALSLFGDTLTSLTVEDTSTTTNHLRLAELLICLAKATPNLKTLAYIRTSTLNIQDMLSSEVVESLSKFEALEVLMLHLRRQKLGPAVYRVKAVVEHTFEQCPSLRCVALKDEQSYSYCRRQGSLLAEEDVGTLCSNMLEHDSHSEPEPPCPPSITQTPTHPPYVTW
ncbi:hypothetical protein DXG01_001229 [Tephrocybe rancida]|nr:hypothetical protein DXG01_001229 [Tephrocybe rancida]